MPKGGLFERSVAMDLSRWWSGDPDTDRLCWRTHGSGGRATARGRRGKKVKGHCGDLSAIGPEMETFFRVVTVEVKRGYDNRTSTLSDLLDKPDRAANQEIETFILQAEAAASLAKTPSWLIVHKRDGRVPLCYMPRRLPALAFGTRYWMKHFRRPVGQAFVTVTGRGLWVAFMSFAGFLEGFSPRNFQCLDSK
jgi:hypothetical protein